MTTKKGKQPLRKKKKNKPNWIGIFSLVTILIFIFVYIISNRSMWGDEARPPKPKTAASQKQDFTVEGKLQFLDKAKNVVADFFIEVADDPYSREKGMMYRYYIPDTLGMLFIFPKEDHRFFWMKNTPSSLDIIYADEDFNIVRIHENTPPYSETTIPSGDKAKYVIELKAGTVARYGINTNQSFTWEPLK